MGLYTKEDIQKKLEQELKATVVKIEDVSDGCGAKFTATIVSSCFEGKPRLQRHRMVNEVLEEEMKSIHAFSQTTLTPAQWEKRSSSE